MTDLEVLALFEKFAEAFVKVYGAEVWHSLTGQEQHDTIIFVLKDIERSLE